MDAKSKHLKKIFLSFWKMYLFIFYKVNFFFLLSQSLSHRSPLFNMLAYNIDNKYCHKSVINSQITNCIAFSFTDVFIHSGILFLFKQKKIWSGGGREKEIVRNVQFVAKVTLGIENSFHRNKLFQVEGLLLVCIWTRVCVCPCRLSSFLRWEKNKMGRMRVIWDSVVTQYKLSIIVPYQCACVVWWRLRGRKGTKSRYFGINLIMVMGISNNSFSLAFGKFKNCMAERIIFRSLQ